MPRNSLLNGRKAPDTGGDQLDESSYPILMAWQSGLAGDRALYRDHIKKAADFVVAHGPSFGSERWEEQGGFSPSTIAAEIAGLVAAGRIADVNGDHASRPRLPGHRRLLPALDQGLDGHHHRPVRAGATSSGCPRPATRTRPITYNLGNGGPDADQRAVVDAGFQELTRLGALPANDPDVLASLPVVDQTIRTQTEQRHRLLPVRHVDAGHRGRVRRLLRRRPDELQPGRQAVADRQRRLRALLAGAVRRAGRAAAADRRPVRRGRAADRDERRPPRASA